jgi:hypothetical protein
MVIEAGTLVARYDSIAAGTTVFRKVDCSSVIAPPISFKSGRSGYRIYRRASRSALVTSAPSSVSKGFWWGVSEHSVGAAPRLSRAR